ncbi:hypothetical protein SLE2022_405740 [Rubroshorea leprosula]
MRLYGDSMTGFPAERSADRSRRPIRGKRRAPHPMAMFFRGFLKHPVMVGSIIPSSPQLIRRMLAPVDWNRTRVFVEYGPGVGTFTRPILDRLAPRCDAGGDRYQCGLLRLSASIDRRSEAARGPRLGGRRRRDAGAARAGCCGPHHIGPALLDAPARRGHRDRGGDGGGAGAGRQLPRLPVPPQRARHHRARLRPDRSCVRGDQRAPRAALVVPQGLTARAPGPRTDSARGRWPPAPSRSKDRRYCAIASSPDGRFSRRVTEKSTTATRK